MNKRTTHNIGLALIIVGVLVTFTTYIFNADGNYTDAQAVLWIGFVITSVGVIFDLVSRGLKD
jgi:uncharacterized membrane protein YczE